MNRTTLVGSITAACLSLGSANAAINFTFDFSDPSNGSLWTPERQAALNFAADKVESYFANYTATIDLEVKSSNDASAGTLASAASADFVPAHTPGFSNSHVVMHKILGGTDPNGATSDGVINMNWGPTEGWDLSQNMASVSPTAYDFTGLLMHEIMHAVGFASSIKQTGLDPFNLGDDEAGDWSPFDRYIGNSSLPLIDQATFQMNQSAYQTAVIGGAGSAGLALHGPNTLAANGGQPVWLYTPTTYADGSSGSHLDDQFPAYNFMMEATASTGPRTRTLSGVEIGILRDMGYTMVVPEPTSGLLAFLGLGTFLIKRRRR